jgi:copper chaperone CopZ
MQQCRLDAPDSKAHLLAHQDQEDAMITLSVPEMHCNSCKASVEAVLKPISGTRYVTVDLAQRRVAVGGSPAPDEMIGALHRIGFAAEVVPA